MNSSPFYFAVRIVSYRQARTSMATYSTMIHSHFFQPGTVCQIPLVLVFLEKTSLDNEQVQNTVFFCDGTNDVRTIH